MSDWAVRCVNLTVKRQSRTILSLADFRVAAGASCGIAGSNGSGKSTLLGVLAGLIGPTSGSATLCGTDPRGWSALRGRRGVHWGADVLSSWLSLEAYLVELATLQGLSASEAARSVAKVMHQLDLHSVSHKRCRDLSVSEVRGASIAQALLGRPEIILVDEPTEGLDSTRARRVLETLAERKTESTLLLAARDPEVIAALCESAILLSHGREVWTGATSMLGKALKSMHEELPI